MIHIKRILYPTDFSSYSTQAYFHAIALSEKHGASLTILYVYAPPTGTPPLESELEADRHHWREQLQQVRPTNSTIPVHHVFVEGDPASEIVRYTRDAGIDLVVMGTHGRTGLERLLMGSVAEKTLREAPCSVLVVKMPKGVPVVEKGDVAVATSSA